MKTLTFSSLPKGTRDSPSVRFFVSVVERFQFLLPLLSAEASGVGNSEEGWSKLHQPAGIDGGHLPHVLFSGQYQLVVHKPEERILNMKYIKNEGFMTTNQ